MASEPVARSFLYRPVRGGLAQAMSEIVRIHGGTVQLAQHLGVEPSRVHVKPYIYDQRIKWDTYLVCVDGFAAGYTDGPVIVNDADAIADLIGPVDADTFRRDVMRLDIEETEFGFRWRRT